MVGYGGQGSCIQKVKMPKFTALCSREECYPGPLLHPRNVGERRSGDAPGQ